jgi:hypothetical protein
MPVQTFRTFKRWVAGKRAGQPFVRLTILRRYGVSPIRQRDVFFRYLLHGRETTNFTYDIANIDELGRFVAEATGSDLAHIKSYLAEPSEDVALIEDLSERLEQRGDRDPCPMFGRRLGWYALIRHARPSLVVETGTHDGLGTTLIAHALRRNADEGHPGRLWTFDIDDGSGWLVPDDLRELIDFHFGDSATTLPQMLAGADVEVFIHDSAHTYEHELFELELAVSHRPPDGMTLISDNAHVTDALRAVCAKAGGQFRFFREQPVRHFYPGAGIGLAVIPPRATSAPSEVGVPTV